MRHIARSKGRQVEIAREHLDRIKVWNSPLTTQ